MWRSRVRGCTGSRCLGLWDKTSRAWHTSKASLRALLAEALSEAKGKQSVPENRDCFVASRLSSAQRRAPRNDNIACFATLCGQGFVS
jgi:hypothetical protein